MCIPDKDIRTNIHVAESLTSAVESGRLLYMLIDFEMNNIYIEYVVCNHGSLLNIQITVSTAYTSRIIITNLT